MFSVPAAVNLPAPMFTSAPTFSLISLNPHTKHVPTTLFCLSRPHTMVRQILSKQWLLDGATRPFHQANLPQPLHRPSGEQASCMAMKDIRISDHGNWRHIHWQAIVSAYNESPFFEYYADDFRPFFERRFDFLFDFNLELTHTICTLLDFTPNINLTPAFVPTQAQLASGASLPAAFADADTGSIPTFQDFRDTIVPKNPPHDPGFTPRPYYQVFAQRHGFLPNLSVIDLLFNMGNEAPLYL